MDPELNIPADGQVVQRPNVVGADESYENEPLLDGKGTPDGGAAKLRRKRKIGIIVG